jgi:thiol-disulfide isomerase/thioredoxin
MPQHKSKPLSKGRRYVILTVCCIVPLIIAIAFITLNRSPSIQSTVAQDLSNVGGLPIGSRAPEFTLNDPIRGVIDNKRLTDKPLFIFFTTTWCTPCQVGARELARYYDETNKAFNVLIVFVDPNESDDSIIAWKKNYGRDDWYIAKGYDMALKYNIKYLDSKYAIDRDGIIRYFDVRPLSYSTAKSVIEPLLR